MSTIKLDTLYAHKDDMGPATEGHFGNIYHTWDQAAARRREINNRQRTIAANKLTETQ